MLGEIQTDNFDTLRPYALYARIRPRPEHPFDIQIGRIPPTFGAYGRRSYGPDDPLIGYPIVYQYATTLRSDALPATADLPRLKAAVETLHAPTVLPIAADYSQRIGADLFVVTTPAGGVLAAIETDGDNDDNDNDDDNYNNEANLGVGGSIGTEKTFEPDQRPTWFRADSNGVMQVVSAPIWIDPRQPELLGRLVVGFKLDQDAVERFKRLTDSEVAIGMDGRIVVSTLDAVHHAELSRVAVGSQTQSVVLGGEEFVAAAHPLAGAASDAAPVALVLRSRTARLRFLRPLQTSLIVTAVVALLVAPLLSWVVARTVTRPLGTVTATMREVALTGDLSKRVSGSSGRWQDEDTRLLASSFNRLLGSIDRFQQEAGQRERLSSLGRLATVVAHEVRNPLMIIKAVLRTLRRDSVSPATVRGAVADIDEEVVRLNRIVTDVLDFARPIRFELETVALGALCTDAVEAVRTDWPEGTVELDLDPEVRSLRTDREHLRLVLVNLLSNARDAVMARSAGSEPRMRIQLRTRADRPGGTDASDGGGDGVGNDDWVIIEVKDEGIGISAGDVDRIFEPYFTTKRTGTGLGLAISKHIVEGLGGSVIVTSQRGEGTTVRLTMPRDATSAVPTASSSPVEAGE